MKNNFINDFRLGHHDGDKIINFLIEKKSSNKFYKSLYSRLESGLWLTQKQLACIYLDIKCGRNL